MADKNKKSRTNSMPRMRQSKSATVDIKKRKSNKSKTKTKKKANPTLTHSASEMSHSSRNSIDRLISPKLRIISDNHDDIEFDEAEHGHLTPLSPNMKSINFMAQIENNEKPKSRQHRSASYSLNEMSKLSKRRRSSVKSTHSNRNSISSVASLTDDENALIKRLKSENKELRKSRNSIRKEHSVLLKIESKLRHKLSIILAKFKHLNLDDLGADIDWNKLQKSGDVEGIFDAIFTKMNQITDQYIKRQSQWEMQNTKWNNLKREYKGFSTEYLVNNANANDSNSKANGNGKSKKNGAFEMENMFTVLKQRFDGYKSSNLALNKAMSEKNDLKMKYKQQTMQIQRYEQSNKTQMSEIKKFESELVAIRKTNKLVEKEKNDWKSKFEQSHIAINNKMKGHERELANLREEYDTLSQLKDMLYNDFSTIKKRNESMEKEKTDLKNNYKKQLSAMNTEMDYNSKELSKMTSKYKTLENAKLEKDNEVLSLQKQLELMRTQLSESNTKCAELQKLMNKKTKDQDTQTEFIYNAENPHMKALQGDNDELMRELNFLIAERSKFKKTESVTDLHRGDISCIAVSPIEYTVATGGKQDDTLRLWKPLDKGGGKSSVEGIKFVPFMKAFIDGHVLSLNMNEDGDLLAAGCSYKNTPNGYIVVWDIKKNGTVLCNLRSRSIMRFGKVHCVEFMKYNPSSLPSFGGGNSSNNSRQRRSSKNALKKRKKSRTSFKNKNSVSSVSNGKTKNGRNYLLFGGDTTGCILCWNLAMEHLETPVAIIKGHSDIIYDLSIIGKKYLFSVSHDQRMMMLNIEGFWSKVPDANTQCIDYAWSDVMMKDEKYPLQAIGINKKTNEIIFGSRKCNIFKVGDGNDGGSDGDDDDESKFDFVEKSVLKCKDLDRIKRLRVRKNLLIVQRINVNYVKVFNLESNKLVKNYEIDGGDDTSYKIYDCGLTYNNKYAVMCVAVLTDENSNNLELNRSALKAFKIPRSKKN